MKASITFGQWVKQRRKVLGLTQADVGRLVSCSKVMINKIEGDLRRPSVQTARLLIRHLKIAPKDHATFISLARPDLSPEEVEEIVIPMAKSLERSTSRRVTNLPTPLTSLIGRAQEVTTVCALLLHPDVRLVTLTGAGGMGKTRLGLQVGTDLHDEFIDGCWFVSLAAVQEADLMISTIARSLGIKESRERALHQAVLSFLADKDMLLLLDNFEQVAAAAKQVAEILAFAPGLKILVTSRAVLHLSGEYEFVVPPLRFVDLHASLSHEDLITSPAVSLFVQRAQAVDANFRLTLENAPAVAKICARLDGLPLAIELAASRIKFYTPATLLARLERSSAQEGPLDLLAHTARDLPARQQTIRRTIDWSYDLLNQDEQNLFRYLAVFVGGSTLEATAAVCEDTGNEFLLPSASSSRTLDAFADKLASLVDQSMLLKVKTQDEEPRFGMLDSLREYAIERLATPGEELTTIRRRHASYFMALVESGEPRFAGPEQEAWLDHLETEHDNLLAALAWSYASEENAELGLRLAGAVWQFWLIRGYVNEGRLWLQRFLERAKSAPKMDRARALNGAGFLNWAWSDYRQAKLLLNESLALFRELGDRHGTAWALNHLGHVALAQNELELASSLVGESLALFRELGADWNVAWDLLNFGDILLEQGHEARAISHYVESLELFRKVGDHRGAAWALDHLGCLAREHQDYQQASMLFTEGLSLFRKLRDKWSTAWVLNHLGRVALAQGDFPQAQLLVEESLALFEETSSLSNGGATLDLGWATLSLGDAAWELGDEARAKTLFTQSSHLFNKVDDQRGAAEALERLERLERVLHAEA